MASLGYMDSKTWGAHVVALLGGTMVHAYTNQHEICARYYCTWAFNLWAVLCCLNLDFFTGGLLPTAPSNAGSTVPEATMKMRVNKQFGK